jgi:hypothetical protein
MRGERRFKTLTLPFKPLCSLCLFRLLTPENNTNQPVCILITSEPTINRHCYLHHTHHFVPRVCGAGCGCGKLGSSTCLTIDKNKNLRPPSASYQLTKPNQHK